VDVSLQGNGDAAGHGAVPRLDEVVAAAMLKGAVFGGVKAVVDRTFATEYFCRTGIWPGKTGKPQD
jgi:hypothetical protein